MSVAGFVVLSAANAGTAIANTSAAHTISDKSFLRTFFLHNASLLRTCSWVNIRAYKILFAAAEKILSKRAFDGGKIHFPALPLLVITWEDWREKINDSSGNKREHNTQGYGQSAYQQEQRIRADKNLNGRFHFKIVFKRVCLRCINKTLTAYAYQPIDHS